MKKLGMGDKASTGVEAREVTFKLDTSAKVTAISEETYKMLGPIPLEKPSKALYGPT